MRDISEKERRLIKFESYLDCRLPEDYRDFLLWYEGAEFEKRNLPKHGVWKEKLFIQKVFRLPVKDGEPIDIPIHDNQVCYSFEGPLFWLTDQESSSLLQQNISWQEWPVEDRWFHGKDYIAFASDGFGNYFCMGIRDPDRGKIYFWDHEEGLGEQKLPSATSFTDFLSLLRTEQDTYIPEEEWLPDKDAKN